MNVLKTLLTPKNVGYEKKRLGPQRDGGYVTPIYLLEECSELYTYGVGHDVRYENEFTSEYNKKSWLYDHTSGASVNNKLSKKFNEGIGWGDNLGDFNNHYEQNNSEGEIYFKIDTEGAEYDYFLDDRFDYSKFKNRVMGIAIEVHWLKQPEFRQKFIKLAELLQQDYILCHVHGNNWCDEFDFEGYTFVDVMELTYLRKDHCKYVTEDTAEYPIKGLDYPNRPNSTDFDFKYLKNE